MDEKFALLFWSEFSIGNGEFHYQVDTLYFANQNRNLFISISNKKYWLKVCAPSLPVIISFLYVCAPSLPVIILLFFIGACSLPPCYNIVFYVFLYVCAPSLPVRILFCIGMCSLPPCKNIFLYWCVLTPFLIYSFFIGVCFLNLPVIY